MSRSAGAASTAQPVPSVVRVPLLLALTFLAGSGCHHPAPPSTPESALAAFVSAARDRNESAARRLVTRRSLELMRELESTAREIHASNVPENVLASFLTRFRDEDPDLRGTELHGDTAVVSIRYRSGHAARLSFVREDGAWKLDLARDLEPSLALLQAAKGRLDALARGELVPTDDD